MATDRSFNDMLNEHLDYDLMKAEYIKRDWLLSFVEKDDTWKGGTIPVPFKGGQASSVAFGSLTDASDIGASTLVRGTISSYKEMWSSLKFNHTDVIQHNGKVKEDSFLKLLPDEMEDFTQKIKELASCQMLNGHKAIVTGNGDSSGNITVDHPERFTIGEKVYVDDDGSSPTSACYVRTINMNSGVITLYDARTAGSVVNLSGYTVAENAKIYLDGAQSNGFTSLRSQLLSSANGGASTLFGQTKTAYPYLQALNLDGSGFTEDNILEGVFNKYVTARNRCSGNPRNLVASFKNGAAILKNLEVGKGAYNVVAGSNKVSAYGWQEVEIGGPKGMLKLVMVQEMEDDIMLMLSDKGIKFHSNGFFQKRVGPDGLSYYTTRATTGYTYIVDIALYGELAVYAPSSHAIIYDIDFALSESAS